jgi:hypothetical protein
MMHERRAIGAATSLLVIFGIAVRTWHLTADPMWLDEAYSAYAAGHGFAFLWRVVPLYESHPPFYYGLLHLWVSAFGDGLRALRSLGWIAGLATLPVMALAAEEASRWLGWGDAQRRRLRFAAIGFACLSPAMIEMARQIRPYPIMILAYAAALALMLRMARVREAGRPLVGRAFASYFLLLETILWLHNLGPLYALSLTLALAITLLGRGQRRGDLVWLAAAHIAVALAYLPGLMILRSQATTWTTRTWLQFKPDIGLLDHIQTLYGVPGWTGLAGLFLAILGVLALARTSKGIRLAAMLLTLALLPVAMAIILSMTIAPVFITRILTPVAAPALLLFAIGAVAPGRYRILPLGGAVMLGASMLGGDIQARMAGPMQDWYRTVDWLAARFRPGDQIFAYPNEGKLPLLYALRDKGLAYPIRAIPTDVPALEARHGWHPTGTRGVSSLPQAELHAIAQEPATQAVPTIWLLRLGATTYDPGDGFLRELHRGRYIVRSWQHGPIDIIGLRRLPAKATGGTGR